ncbi:hypothetical protein BDV41DRAFT_541453 [Aspergillus transmontanensis]|uniref:Uncharacterized protein n=1 Tax=Aspergillus transmontanensis TaxID=1034304 RepID=A0A5N6VTU1_9EURO|nr:hypothetical protein BDV41DRAFT_541453 [Aspergillus transmontanensis]
MLLGGKEAILTDYGNFFFSISFSFLTLLVFLSHMIAALCPSLRSIPYCFGSY